MNCWQIIYNASPSGITGSSGFGVRTATEGIPKDILERVGRDTSLMSYISGTFSIANEGKTLFENPERIREWPKRYFYKEIPLNLEKKIYVFGRAVYAGFEHSFYSTRKPSRTGNFIVHIFVFDHKPDKEIFTLLQENPTIGDSSFYPMDYTPSLDNHQMLFLMTGKPEPLAVEEFSPQKWTSEISEEAYDLFFEYRESMSQGKPFVVKMPVEKTAEACAGLMRLLPPSLASDTTFEINHQQQGLSVGSKITFVNQYYQYMVSPLTCHFLDYGVGYLPSKMEDIYRKRLKKAVDDKRMDVAERLASWIWSDMAVEHIEDSEDFNISLFNYCQNPEEFLLDDIRNVPGLISSLGSWIGQGKGRDELLISRMVMKFEKAKSGDDLIDAVTLCEIVRDSGIRIDTSLERSIGYLTSYAVDHPSFVAMLLELVGPERFKDYIDIKECTGRAYILDDSTMKNWWSKTYMYFLPKPYDLKKILMQMLGLNIDFQQVKDVLSAVEPSSESRASVYVSILKDNASALSLLMPLLKWDKDATDRVDFLNEFKDEYSNNEFAPLFLNQLAIKTSFAGNLSFLITTYSELCRNNAAFAELVLGNQKGMTVYADLLAKFRKGHFRKEDFAKWAEQIRIHILSVIPDSMSVKTDWGVIYKVLLFEKPADNFRKYYEMAVEINAPEAVSVVAANMFGLLESEKDIRDFVNNLKSWNILNDHEILEYVEKLDGDSIKGLYLAAVVENKDYQSLSAAAEKVGVKDTRNFIKVYFPEIYKSEKKKEISEKWRSVFRSLFAKKEDRNK